MFLGRLPVKKIIDYCTMKNDNQKLILVLNDTLSNAIT